MRRGILFLRSSWRSSLEIGFIWIARKSPLKSLFYWQQYEHARKVKLQRFPVIQVFFLALKYCKHFKVSLGLLWWRSGWESTCQCRGHGFEPWSGRIPHAAEQLSPWATTAEPARLEPVLHNKRGRSSERPVHRDEEWPPLAATGESPRTETKTQHSQK